MQCTGWSYLVRKDTIKFNCGMTCLFVVRPISVPGLKDPVLTMLVEQQEGHPACKKLGVGLFVATI